VADRRVLALDLGTSSVRALVFDERGATVPGMLTRRPTHLEISDEGKAELDPDEVAGALGECLDELAGGGGMDGIEHVATSCAWHSVIALGADGRRLTGALTWADTRAAPLVAELRSRGDMDRLQAATGARPHTLYWTVKLPWLARELSPAPARYLGLAEYVTGALLGDPAASPSMASGTGLLELATATWDEQALELAGVDAAALPEVAPGDWTGRLGAEGATSNVGAGCVSPDRVAINIGTSAAIRAVEEAGAAAPLHRELWRYLVDDRHVVSGAAFSGAGNLYAWLRQVTALPEEGSVDDELAKVPPGSRGVVVMPYHAGSRPPLDLAAGSGAITGLSLATTAIEILAATLESVCYRLASGYEALASGMGREPEVVASGGAIVASPWWQQTLADVLGRPVRIVDEPEASARGAALLALGQTTDPATVRTVEPRPDAVEAQRAARALHEDLAARLGYR
jgi:gluconokinase